MKTGEKISGFISGMLSRVFPGGKKSASQEEISPRPFANGDRPLVVMMAGKQQSPTRGDVHGAIGLARRLAVKIGGDFHHLDANALAERYRDVRGEGNRFIRAMQETGVPDVVIAHPWPEQNVRDFLDDNGNGLFFCSINETTRSIFDKPGATDVAGLPDEIVPHNITPDIFEREGLMFAREFSELPRPFIAVNYTDLSLIKSIDGLADHLASLRNAYEEATFFICSTHRTPGKQLRQLVNRLEQNLWHDADRFPVIEFDFKTGMIHEGPDSWWNPYRGMLQEADHVIVAGYSSSILSEALATGKTAHLYEMEVTSALRQSGLVSFMTEKTRGKPLETRALETPVDINGYIVDKMAKMLDEKRRRPETAQTPKKKNKSTL